jgi:hypothetical protein
VPAKQLFEYAVIRVVPCVEREEFLNVGVIVYCPTKEFLKAAFEIDRSRLSVFSGRLDISEIEEHLLAFECICAGGVQAGPIGELPMGARFRWLTAPRSTIIQTSPVHTGFCVDPYETLARLLPRLAR